MIAAGALGLWLRRPRLALALAALALAVNVGLAAYHVGIEQGWLALPEGCAAARRATTIEELRRQLADSTGTLRSGGVHASPACRSPPGTRSTPPRNGGAYVWGRLPSSRSGEVVIERRVRGTWKRIARLRTFTSGGLVQKRLRFNLDGVDALRARVGQAYSAAFKLRAPRVPVGIVPFGCAPTDKR